MRVSFELTVRDMQDVQEALMVRKRERIHAFMAGLVRGSFWRHAAFNGLLGLVAGLLVWPLGSAMAGFGPGVMAVAVAIAVPIATWIQRRIGMPRVRYRALNRWSSRRQGARAAQRSVLGLITVDLTPEALVRHNATGSLAIPWTDVLSLCRAPQLLLVTLRSKRMVVVPARAFRDEGERTAFTQALQALAARPLEEIPPL